MKLIHAAAGQFFDPAEIIAPKPYGTGKVNETFIVSDSRQHSFLLQRLSPVVFAKPEQVMENLRIVLDHLEAKLQNEKSRRWEIPTLYQTRSGNDFYRDDDGSVWRVFRFIEQSSSFDTIKNEQQAREAGFALGFFHKLISDIDPARLHDTLPEFHVTPGYLAEYDTVFAKTTKTSADIRFCHEFIKARRGMAHVLEDAKKAGHLVLRPIHGDPKLSNILFDEKSCKAVSLIDLDTVKPGLVHYDIGDCLRSCCNPAGEESPLSKAAFDTDLCRAILQGYFEEAKTFFSPLDFDYLFDAVRLISFELGVRFFSDFLGGNSYFKTSYADQNLHRALVQFAVTKSIEGQEKKMRLIIGEIA